MAKIVTIANQKGGVGKTTTATSLAEGLNRNGYRTLLIDMDPQSNATDTFELESLGTTIYDVVIGEADMASAIQTKNGISLVPGDIRFCSAEKQLNEIGREHILEKALKPILADYDYVVIDTPPTLGILLINALTAADEVIIPLTADRYALQGLQQLKETIDPVREFTNSRLKVRGLLLTRHNPRTNLSQSVEHDLEIMKNMFGTNVFQTTIRECISTREAQALQKGVLEYNDGTTTATDYLNFTNEYIGG